MLQIVHLGWFRGRRVLCDVVHTVASPVGLPGTFLAVLQPIVGRLEDEPRSLQVVLVVVHEATVGVRRPFQHFVAVLANVPTGRSLVVLLAATVATATSTAGLLLQVQPVVRLLLAVEVVVRWDVLQAGVRRAGFAAAAGASGAVLATDATTDEGRQRV